MTVAGYDHQSQSGQVWTVPVGGMCVRQPVSIGGSGSSFLYGMMDHMFKVRLLLSVVSMMMTLLML